jgi:hypothetical protein
MTDKDKKIIEDAEREGIPIFVFTAKDAKALEQLVRYRDDCAEDCSNEHYQGIESRIDDFYQWQCENTDRVKIPD